ncbi:MAG: DNA topoisomerase, partial [Polynucleobacter sp.]
MATSTKSSSKKNLVVEHPKALIIAEKPSVANDIAKALGGFTKHDEYFENEAFLISSAVGHLLEIAAPEEYEVKRGKWSFVNLPVIPPHFDLRPIAKTESRLKFLQKLIKRKDVNRIINACDAGREGELIFRLITQHAKAQQKIERLWLQSMTPAAIREGFNKLRSDDELIPLADAARCRSEADWLVGINGTRAMTAFNSKSGGFFLTTVGRVQTPTLSIVVQREEQIRKFVSKDYWEVRAEFIAAAGIYISNFLFAFWQMDYQNLSAVPPVVIHYWSLAVEEQFYLVWPLFLLFLARYGKRVIFAGIATATLLSLLFSIYLTQVAPIWAFYSLPTRAWELGFGALLLFLPESKKKIRILPWLGFFGIAITSFNFNENTAFP